MLREHPRYEKTAIIFVSAIHLSDVDRIRGYETGAVDYVPVPVIPEILRAKVRIFVELYRKTRQLRSSTTSSSGASPRAHRRAGGLDRAAAPRARSGCVSPARRRASAPTTTTRPPARSTGRPICAGSSAWQGEDPLTLGEVLEFVHPEHRDMVRQHMSGLRAGRRIVASSSSRSCGRTARCAGCWIAGQAMPDGQGRRPAGASSAPSSTSPSAS